VARRSRLAAGGGSYRREKEKLGLKEKEHI
jgi:hypothetical protein